jgi:hypothetical protein
MIKFRRYHETGIKRMTNEEILKVIGEKNYITVYGTAEVFKNKKTGNRIFICSKLFPLVFPREYFDGNTTSAHKLDIYFIDRRSFKCFKESRNVKERLPDDESYERVWYNGNPVIAKADD